MFLNVYYINSLTSDIKYLFLRSIIANWNLLNWCHLAHHPQITLNLVTPNIRLGHFILSLEKM